MPKDYVKDYRKKCRYAFEMTYEPIIDFADNRAKNIELLREKFSHKMTHWKMQNVGIMILNETNKPTKQMYLDHLKCNVNYEDSSTLEEFFNDTVHFLELFHKLTNRSEYNIKRIGVRFVSIFTEKRFINFEIVFNRIMETFYQKNLPISIKSTDCKFILNHEFGTIVVGPLKKDEQYIIDNYNNPTNNVPDFGFGLDVDSFINDIKSSDTTNIIKVFKDVCELTQSVEAEIVNHIIGK